MGLRRLTKNFFYRKKFNSKPIEIKKIINQNILITGANSGFGLALTKKLLAYNNYVFATYRERKENLLKIKNKDLKLIKCDNNNLSQIESISDFSSKRPINIIINNAGIWGQQNQSSLSEITYEDFKNTIMINALSALKITEIILKNKNKNSLKTIVNVSSMGGSITNNRSGDAYVYMTSKSTLNAITKIMSIDLKTKHNINTFCIDPGNTKTNLNVHGILDPNICATNLVKILETSGDEINGKFIDLLKNDIPW